MCVVCTKFTHAFPFQVKGADPQIFPAHISTATQGVSRPSTVLRPCFGAPIRDRSSEVGPHQRPLRKTGEQALCSPGGEQVLVMSRPSLMRRTGHDPSRPSLMRRTCHHPSRPSLMRRTGHHPSRPSLMRRTGHHPCRPSLMQSTCHHPSRPSLMLRTCHHPCRPSLMRPVTCHHPLLCPPAQPTRRVTLSSSGPMPATAADAACACARLHQ